MFHRPLCPGFDRLCFVFRPRKNPPGTVSITEMTRPFVDFVVFCKNPWPTFPSQVCVPPQECSLALLLFFPTSSHAMGEQTVKPKQKVKHMKHDKKNQTVKNVNTNRTVPAPKNVAIQMLNDLHAKLLKQGTAAIHSNP